VRNSAGLRLLQSVPLNHLRADTDLRIISYSNRALLQTVGLSISVWCLPGVQFTEICNVLLRAYMRVITQLAPTMYV
jgi:hypothetical protein